MSKAIAKPDAPDEALLARQLTEQYQRAVGGLWEVVKFGAMMIHLHTTLSARGQSGKGVSNWIEQHCPEISRPTAYRFMAIAEGIRDELQIGVRTDLVKLLTADHKELEPKRLKKQAAIRDFLEGRSQRQLLLILSKPERGAAAGGANQLNQFLREHYPEMVGTAAADLPKHVHKEFIAWRHAQKPSPEEQVEQERQVANDFWTKFIARFHFNFYEATDIAWQKTDRELRLALVAKLEEALTQLRKSLR